MPLLEYYINSYKPLTWDSSVSIVSEYREFVVRFLTEIIRRYLLQSIHTGSEVHPASYLVGSGEEGSFLGDKTASE
jgi:hypothetical protein